MGWRQVCLCMMLASVAMQTTHAQLPDTHFQHQAVMDQDGAFIMLWTPEKDHIQIEVQVAALGYVGLGFSANGGMEDADVVLAWVDDSGTVHLQDRYATGTTTPLIDDSQDVTLLGGYQNDTHTVVRFSRPWNTCDHKHDRKLSEDTIRVIWSYATEDPQDKMTMKHHDHRGTKSIYLKEPNFMMVPSGPHVHTWDLLVGDIPIPHTVNTIYWCKILKAPLFQKKTHMIAFQPKIAKESLPFVHHLIVWECQEWAGKELEKWFGHGGTQCLTANMPPSWKACDKLFLGWAVGSEGEMYPEDVGFPLGEGDGKAKYFMLEMHYDNTFYKKGLVDNSGVTIHYTQKLRKYDGASMLLGHGVSPYMIIPPGHHWTTTAFCSPTCTEHLFPATGVHVFQTMLHSHYIGETINLRHIRNGRELPNTVQDMNYDFNYQQPHPVRNLTILPGDTLITECGYDSTKRKGPTYGGIGTADEMCTVFISYYPRININRCVSSPTPQEIFSPFDIQEIYNKDAGTGDWRGALEEAVDLALEQEIADLLLHQREQPAPVIVDPAETLKTIIIKEPLGLQNHSVYEVLGDEKTWKNKAAVSQLQNQITYGQHKMYCHLPPENIKSGKDLFSFPDFITLNTLDNYCDGPHESQVYHTVQEDVRVTINKIIVSSAPGLCSSPGLMFVFGLVWGLVGISMG